MVYLCGSDLESRFGCASADLDEMLLAGLSERIHVVVETGGASTWHNGLIEREDNQRYCLREGKLVSLEQELGSRDMTRPETLRDFVRFWRRGIPCRPLHPPAVGPRRRRPRRLWLRRALSGFARHGSGAAGPGPGGGGGAL